MLERIAHRLRSSSLGNSTNSRTAAVRTQIEHSAAVAHEEGAATRGATAALSQSIDEHMQALMECADHLGARLERAQAALERIEARLEQLDPETLRGVRTGGA